MQSQMLDDSIADILHAMQIQSEATCLELQGIYKGHLHRSI